MGVARAHSRGAVPKPPRPVSQSGPTSEMFLGAGGVLEPVVTNGDKVVRPIPLVETAINDYQGIFGYESKNRCPRIRRSKNGARSPCRTMEGTAVFLIPIPVVLMDLPFIVILVDTCENENRSDWIGQEI